MKGRERERGRKERRKGKERTSGRTREKRTKKGGRKKIPSKKTFFDRINTSKNHDKFFFAKKRNYFILFFQPQESCQHILRSSDQQRDQKLDLPICPLQTFAILHI